jgi:hypothetical protein
MTNKELQEILKEFPDDAVIGRHWPVAGDCENCKGVNTSALFFDARFNIIVLLD